MKAKKSKKPKSATVKAVSLAFMTNATCAEVKEVINRWIVLIEGELRGIRAREVLTAELRRKVQVRDEGKR